MNDRFGGIERARADRTTIGSPQSGQRRACRERVGEGNRAVSLLIAPPLSAAGTSLKPKIESAS